MICTLRFDCYHIKRKLYGMGTKTLIFIGITVGGLVGGWLGSMLDGGNGFGMWSILLSTIGSLAGIWGGYKLAQGME